MRSANRSVSVNMSILSRQYIKVWARRALAASFFCLLAIVPNMHAADQEDFDSYKIKVEAFWFYAQPSGSLSGSASRGYVDFQKDVGFNSYSTFSGRVDWKFTRKNHLFFAVTPFDHSKSFAASRTITFQGQTFDVGVSANANLQVNAYAPGYQYDIIRRRRGHLGVQVQLDLFDVNGSVSASAQIVGGVARPAERAQGSLRAPLPVAGPNFRYYLTRDSNRVFVDGNVLGMYFFGYGNFVSTFGTVGITATKHLAVRGGYQLGSRMNVNNNASNRIGVSLTQKGPVIGVEIPF